MQRSFAWGMIAILVIMLAPFVGVFGVPASAVQADAASPTVAPPDDEVIVITSAGQLRVDDPYTPTGYKPVSWNSGSDTGWTVVAGGDFNGDGDAELVAARGSLVKVFDPIVQPGRAPVAFTVDLGSQRNARLLNTGDFDADGKDEFAVVNYVPGGSIQAALQVYDGGTNATASEWTRQNYAEYAVMFQDMGVGDFNADGTDDFVLQRNPSQQSKLLLTLNGRNLTAIAQQGFNFSWLAVAGGNISSATAGDEIAASRGDVLATLVSALVFRVSGSSFVDMLPNSNYKFYPYFTSVAAGDLNGDADDEMLLLRDPGSASGTSLIALNPFGAAMRDFQVKDIGGGTTAWHLVRTGDVDGDGRDEVVIIRSAGYRIYTQPEVDNFAPPDTTGPFYAPNTSNLPFMALANVDGGGQILGPILSVSPTTLSFNLEYRQPSSVQNISVSNLGTSDVLNWQAAVTAGAPWLLLNQTSGITPGTLGVSVDTNAIAPGTYTGKISISATSASGAVQGTPQEVTVNVTIQGVAMVISPTLLTFNVKYGDVSPIKPVSIASAGGSSLIDWRAEIVEGADWLLLNPMQGTSPSTMSVSVNTRAKPLGSYSGTIRIRALDTQVADAIQFVTVDMTVADGGVVVTPGQVMIQHQVGAPPNTAEVLIERPSFPTAWTATVLPAALAEVARAKLAAGEYQVLETGIVLDGVEAPALDWLTFTPSSGTTDTTMTLTVQGDTPGVYNAIIFVNSATGTTREIHVTGWIANQFYATYAPLVFK